MSNLVIVESPAKAKTINKYLGSDYKVLASFGHVRDLPPKDGSVDPEHGFAMRWELTPNASKSLKDIKKEAKSASKVILATDPDREGEAISWHISQLLEEDGLIKGKQVERVVFHEVTRKAVQAAMEAPREINQDLVEAYLTRRALDYLVGFTLSPVLWRKLPGSKSAGRVQSVALRLICERETEIENFTPQEYWTIVAQLTSPKGEVFEARLTHLDGKKLDKFALPDEASAKAAVAAIKDSVLYIQDIEQKKVKRNPYPPFRTSTLQQEAARKLGFGASKTMRTAQQLYEGVEIGGQTVGLITYMRTDGVTLSMDSIMSTRAYIEKEYGKTYLPDSPRVYKSKQKNAQEAHEAIRPTDITLHPGKASKFLTPEQLRLYDLIWKRTVACQMEQAVLDQVAIVIEDKQGQKSALRATGSVISFDGFLKLYQEGKDDKDDDEDEDSRILPPLHKDDDLKQQDVTPNQHFTQPPPRYTEASLVKRMEELGIGRPSTYASILQVLQARNYVRLDSKRFIPEDRGRIVTAFLENFFRRYVEYDFTAGLEEQLDDVSGGRQDWQKVLQEFWGDFKTAIDGTKELRITQVIDILDEELGDHFFPQTNKDVDPRQCPTCSEGRLSIKLGKYGAFIGCSRYPDCKYTKPLEVTDGQSSEDEDRARLTEPKDLGVDPETSEPVSLRIGPYGPYVQRGDGTDKKKLKRSAIPKGYPLQDIDLARALKFLTLPREVGIHPENGEMVHAGIGQFGPYLKIKGMYKSLKGDDDVLEIGINRAVDVLGDIEEMEKKKAARAARSSAKKSKGKAAAKTGAKKKAPAKKKTTAKKKAPAKKTKKT